MIVAHNSTTMVRERILGDLDRMRRILDDLDGEHVSADEAPGDDKFELLREFDVNDFAGESRLKTFAPPTSIVAKCPVSLTGVRHSSSILPLIQGLGFILEIRLHYRGA